MRFNNPKSAFDRFAVSGMLSVMFSAVAFPVCLGLLRFAAGAPREAEASGGIFFSVINYVFLIAIYFSVPLAVAATACGLVSFRPCLPRLGPFVLRYWALGLTAFLISTLLFDLFMTSSDPRPSFPALLLFSAPAAVAYLLCGLAMWFALRRIGWGLSDET